MYHAVGETPRTGEGRWYVKSIMSANEKGKKGKNDKQPDLSLGNIAAASDGSMVFTDGNILRRLHLTKNVLSVSQDGKFTWNMEWGSEVLAGHVSPAKFAPEVPVLHSDYNTDSVVGQPVSF